MCSRATWVGAVLAFGTLSVSGASAQQTWQVKGGDVGISLLRSLMQDIGIPVEKINATAEPSIEMERAFGLAVNRKSDLIIEADNGRIVRFVGGVVRTSGGFTFQGNRRFVDFSNPSLATNGSDADMGFTLSSGNISFELRHAKVELNPYSRQLIIAFADAIITQGTARVLGRPDLAGQLIGTVSLAANLELLSGTVDPPRFLTDGGGGGEDNPNPVDCQLFAMASLTSLGRLGTYPNGTNGLSMSTTSCNVGAFPIEWRAPMLVDHPVIAMNLYRVHNNRFEHIGLSWLKHGFLSTNSPGCGSCQQPPGGGGQLGINCTDTYGTGNNGDRQYLGERREVNPFTGAWECRGSWFSNYVDDCVRRNGSSSVNDPVSHRLEVRDADLNVAGAEFYYEAYYILKNDIDKYNQIGYRKATASWSGTQWSFSTTTNIVRAPALTVWDPNAQIATPRTEGDVWVGRRVLDLGGGNYRYLYALYVHDLDRQIREFSVPILAGANVTNIAFRDVDQDPSNNWTGTYANGMVTWSTQTHAQNPNANSLKYSTVFNFEFDADVPPAGSPVEMVLGQFKPGNVPYRLRANVQGPLAGHIFPSSIQTLFGNGAGTIEDIKDAEGVTYNVQEAPPVALGAPSAHVEVKATASIENPSSIAFGLRSSTTAAPATSVTQRIQLFDYVANSWVTVDSRPASATLQSIEVTPSNPSRFIQPSTREMKARIAMFDPGTLFSFGWQMRIDEVKWVLAK
ncbi:MAG: hypothetical protein KIT74_10270 [Fimbriimonadales bacterium]|nr:hypothetical protein [Fimbriimonadales bacterium]